MKFGETVSALESSTGVASRPTDRWGVAWTNTLPSQFCAGFRTLFGVRVVSKKFTPHVDEHESKHISH